MADWGIGHPIFIRREKWAGLRAERPEEMIAVIFWYKL